MCCLDAHDSTPSLSTVPCTHSSSIFLTSGTFHTHTFTHTHPGSRGLGWPPTWSDVPSPREGGPVAHRRASHPRQRRRPDGRGAQLRTRRLRPDASLGMRGRRREDRQVGPGALRRRDAPSPRHRACLYGTAHYWVGSIVAWRDRRQLSCRFLHWC